MTKEPGPVIAASAAPNSRPSDEAANAWWMFSVHAVVLACIGSDPMVLQRDIAVFAGLTERTVSSVVADLLECGAVQVVGNKYVVDRGCELPVRVGDPLTVGEFLDLVGAASLPTSPS